MFFSPEHANEQGFTIEHRHQTFVNDAQKLRLTQEVANKISEIFQRSCINAEVIHDGED